MKLQIVESNGKLKVCPKCGGTIWRHSRRNRYLNKEKTKGETYTIDICDKCGYTERSAITKWQLFTGKD